MCLYKNYPWLLRRRKVCSKVMPTGSPTDCFKKKCDFCRFSGFNKIKTGYSKQVLRLIFGSTLRTEACQRRYVLGYTLGPSSLRSRNYKASKGSGTWTWAAGVLRQNVRMQGTPNFRCLQFDVGMGQHPYGGQTVQPAKGTIVALLVGFFFFIAEDQIQCLTSCYTSALHGGTPHPFLIQGLAT